MSVNAGVYLQTLELLQVTAQASQVEFLVLQYVHGIPARGRPEWGNHAMTIKFIKKDEKEKVKVK